MISSLLLKPADTSWLTTLYIVAAGLLSWPSLGVALGITESPADAVVAALSLFAIDPPSGLAALVSWAEIRNVPLTTAAATAFVGSFVWSLGWLWQRPTLFDRVRGPATAWITVALLAQLHGRAAVICSGCAIGIVLLCVALLQRSRNAAAGRGVGAGGVGAAGAMLLALVGVVLKPGIAALHLVGGAPPPKHHAGFPKYSSTD